MAIKLTDKDLESIESLHNKEHELIQEGLLYVKQNMALRIIKVIALLLLEIIFYLLIILCIGAFIYAMSLTQNKLYEWFSQVATITQINDTDKLMNIIKLGRLLLFLMSILSIISVI